MKNLLVTLFVTCISFQAFAAGKAKVNVTAKKLNDQNVELTFKTIPADGLAINSEGPWKLEIKDPGQLKFEKMELKRSDWKDKEATFTQTGTVAGKGNSSSVSYKLTAFVCTKDKGQCFREVIVGTTDVTWK